MKNNIKILFLFLILPFIGFAQEDDKKEEKVKEKLARPTFESSAVINNPSSTLYNKGSFEVAMQHRFGLIKESNSLGIYGSANIRIAVSYSILDRLAIGFGTTKNKRFQDFNLKGAILQQTRSNSTPLSITYYGNFAISALTEDNFNMVQDRYSFFNQIIFAKRFSNNFSMQIAPSISHENAVPDTMSNDMWAIAFGAKVKLTSGTNLLIDYSQPLTSYSETSIINGVTIDTPKPGISIGTEFNTSAHAFQIFVTNYWGSFHNKIICIIKMISLVEIS